MEQQVAPLNAMQGAGIGSIAGAAGSPNANNSANNYLQGLESGSYLNPSSNPYLQSDYNMGAQGIQNNVDSQFGAAGRSVLAGAPVQSDMDNNLANQLYGGQYQNTLQQMTQGAALAPAVAQGQYLPGQSLLSTGAGLQSQTQNELNAQSNMYNYNQSLPYNTLSWYSSLVGQNANPFSTSNSQTNATPNQAMTALGGAATGATIGGEFGGPYGAAAGGVGGALIGAFG